MNLSPPPWAASFFSDDLDEIRVFTSGFGESRRSQLGPGAARYRVEYARLGDAALGWLRLGSRQMVCATSAHPLVHVPVDGRLTYRIGRRRAEAIPGRCVVLAAGEAYTCTYGVQEIVALKLDGSRLSKELSALTGGSTDATAAVRGGEVALPPVLRDELEQLIACIADCATAPSDTSTAQLDAKLTEWTALALHREQISASGTPLSARLQGRVEEWVDSNLSEPITLGRMCELAGVGARGLQKSFIKWRGSTPMEWLRQRRLAAARMRLSEGHAGDTVTSIALEAGFTHLGRFAIAYQRAYGESPSATLRMALVASSSTCEPSG